MGEILGGFPADLGPWALLGIFVLLVLTGAMPTRREMRDLRADRDHWRASADTWQQVATKHGMTLERLLEYAETSNHALTEISGAVVRRENQP